MSTEDSTPDLPQALKDKGFSIQNKIASGAFSEVFKAKCNRMSGKELALKRIDLSKCPEEWIEKGLKKEMKILRYLNTLTHPNIVRVYEIMKTRRFAYIFMDLAKKGSVLEFIEKQNKPLTEDKAKIWFGDVACALSYIHSRGVAHRDIKPDNFLISGEDRALLTDFGFACIDSTQTGQRLMKGTTCGTNQYMAPEIRTLKSGQVYDAKISDLYSMGISLYYMINFDFPFNTNLPTPALIRKQNARDFGYRNSSVSKNARDLIFKMLDPIPNTRITSLNVQKHQWFN